jgi:hypothetical protein
MKELDDATIRAHVRRRSGGSVTPAKVDQLTRSVLTRLDEPRAPLLRFLAAAPISARLALAAALVVAVSLIAVPLAGGPKPSRAPSAAGATEGSTAAATADPISLQVLSLAELQRIAALGDSAPYRDHILVADVSLQPDATPPPCVFVDSVGPSATSAPDPCWVNGFVDGASPAIQVAPPTKDIDIPTTYIPAAGMNGPVILRIIGENTVQLVGDAPRVVGDVAWPLRSFISAVQNLPRRMDFRRSQFVVGWPYVVDAQLVAGNAYFCAMQTPSADARLAGFACGATAWLAPSDVQDPAAIVDGWSSRPVDWVRIQNGAYFEFKSDPADAAATAPDQPVRGFYLVGPVLKIDPALCFQCDAGAVAILYARLEPVAIP